MNGRHGSVGFARMIDKVQKRATRRSNWMPGFRRLRFSGSQRSHRVIIYNGVVINSRLVFDRRKRIGRWLLCGDDLMEMIYNGLMFDGMFKSYCVEVFFLEDIEFGVEGWLRFELEFGKVDYDNVDVEFDIACEGFESAFGKRIHCKNIEFDIVVSRHIRCMLT